MLHSDERIIKHKLGLLNLAEGLGNVSHARRVMGLSRDTFFRYKETLERKSAEEGLVLTEAQFAALEKKKLDDEVAGTAHPGYLGSHDAFYVGTLMGVGRVYQ